ncbi:MAG: NAD(P)-binding domain-containing protein [Clostridiales bacterium]|nr:NAD(P)-binding domain-containing protein [Clostridiales bacterium]
MKIGIIGYGSMGRMITEKIAASGSLAAGDIFVSNRSQEKLQNIPEGVIVCENNCDLAQKVNASEEDQGIVFLCVRPVDLKNVFSEMATDLSSETLVVSLNGSITFDMLSKFFSGKMAKVIPSVTAEVNRSQTLVCYNGKAEENDKQDLESLLRTFGNVIELPEDEIGMGSELVSCMPGFIASIFDVLCASAKKHTSIPDDQVVKMVLQTMCATGELMLEKNMSFEDVVSRVATKGGITEEGTKVVYEAFPKTADLLFEKTLEKRRMTAEKAKTSFEEDT